MKVSNINNNYRYNASFGGAKDCVPQYVVKKFENLNQWAARKNSFKNLIEFLSPKDKSFSHIIATESVILSTGYMVCTATSDKIDKKQKPQLIMSDAFTLAFSTLGAYFLDDKIKKYFDKFNEWYFEKNKDFYINEGIKKQAENAQSPINNILKKVAETFGKKDKQFETGITEISSSMNEDLKNILRKKDEKKAFQVTADVIEKAKENVKNVIKNASSLKDAQEGTKKIITELYNASSARNFADSVKPWFVKVRKFSMFALSYRLIGPNVSSLLTLRADKEREKLERESEMLSKQTNA